MSQPVLRIAIAVVLCVFSASESFAQMGYQACSLEWLVADSDIVVRAELAKVELTPIVHENDRAYRNPEVWKTVTLRVRETLKGEPAESLKFVERTSASDRIYEGWIEGGREELWFLVTNKGRSERNDAAQVAAETGLRPFGGGWSVIRLGSSVVEERGFRSLPPPIFSMDLSVLEKPKDILRKAREAVAFGGKGEPARGYGIELPRGLMQRSGRSGDANSLMVPIDHRLETLALRLIDSPGDFLPKFEWAETDRLRLEGVKAIRYFPTKEHVLLLKSLLDDPAWSIHVSPSGTEAKVYDIREEADKILHSWGTVASKSALGEASPRP